MYAGTDVNAVIAAGVSTGEFMYDLFSGNTGDLRESGKKMGESLCNIITSNKFAQIIGSEFKTFGNVMEETFTHDKMMDLARKVSNSGFGNFVQDLIGWPPKDNYGTYKGPGSWHYG
jgi:hypothetical protein